MKQPKQLVHDMIGKNMPKIQADLSDEEMKQLDIYKLHHDLPTKQEALKHMLRNKGGRLVYKE